MAPVRFGKYELEEPLGQGGMAEVWRARVHGIAGFQRKVVLKRILGRHADSDEFVRMFEREARLSALLHHRNIVQVFDFGCVDGEHYLAMEYLEGHNLSRTMGVLSRAPMDPGFGAYVAREVCRALHYAHACKDERGRSLEIIHRDVSPSNVMLGRDGAVKLLDFGIAKVVSTATQVSSPGTVSGKLSYMAPEQLHGERVDGRADLFAVGVVLHEMLTGRRLFLAEDEARVVALRQLHLVPEPSAINPAVSPRLQAICLRALERDPAARFATGEEMAAALDEIVSEYHWGPERLAALLPTTFPEVVTRGTPVSSATVIDPPTPVVVPAGSEPITVAYAHQAQTAPVLYNRTTARKPTAQDAGDQALEPTAVVAAPAQVATRPRVGEPPARRRRGATTLTLVGAGALATLVAVAVVRTPGPAVPVEPQATSASRAPTPAPAPPRSTPPPVEAPRAATPDPRPAPVDPPPTPRAIGERRPSAPRPAKVRAAPGKDERPSPNLDQGDVIDPYRRGGIKGDSKR